MPACLPRYGARVEAGFAMRSLADSLAAIYRTEGVRGLWKGSIPSIIKVRGEGWGGAGRRCSHLVRASACAAAQRICPGKVPFPLHAHRRTGRHACWNVRVLSQA